MIVMTSQARASLVAFCGVLLGAAWIAYGILGHGNTLFLAIVLIISIVVPGGIATLIRTRH